MRARGRTAVSAVGAVLALGGLLTGCAGDAFSSGGGGAEGSSGLAGALTLNTLDAAERISLCDELKALVDEDVDQTEYRQLRCTIEAWSATSNEPDATRAAACQSRYDDCLRLSNVMVSALVACDAFVPDDADCATVSDLRECYGAWGPYVEQAIAQAGQSLPHNCVEAVMAGGVNSQLMAQTSAPRVCIQLSQTCPAP